MNNDINLFNKNSNAYQKNLNNYNQKDNFNKKNKNNVNNFSNKNNINNNMQTDKGYVILKCEGNTTYILSTLYCLANNNKINDYILETYKNNNIEDTKKWITFLFWRILLHLKESNKQEYSLYRLFDTVKSFNLIFNGVSNQKVADFLIFLLDKFHEEDKLLKQLKQKSELTEDIYTNSKNFEQYLLQNEKTFIFDNFAWINEKSMKCLSCQNETRIYSFYFTYDLNITSVLNKYIIDSKSEENKKILPYLDIKQCIAYNTKKEMLYNVYCHKCDKKTNLERKSKIYSVGNSIIFLLNGIENENIIQLIKKNNINIIIESKLSLVLNSQYKREYEINSGIYYDYDNKKYINYCFKNNKWKRYSDNDIKTEKSDNFLSNFNIKMIPVILFYSAKQ